MVTGYLIGLCLGVMIGAAFTFVICHIPKRRIGTLRVDQSDPNDAEYLFLELSVPVDVVKQQKRIMLDVNVENYLSQK